MLLSRNRNNFGYIKFSDGFEDVVEWNHPNPQTAINNLVVRVPEQNSIFEYNALCPATWFQTP